MENNNQQPTKPSETLKFWSEFILKIITGVVLVWISNDISQTIQMADTTQKFINDLTQTDKTHRDIALVSLNGTVGDKYPKMLAAMSQVLLEEDLEKSENNEFVGAQGFAAYKILKERSNKDDLKEIENFLQAKYPRKMTQVISNSGLDTEKNTVNTAPEKNLVYIQFLKDAEVNQKSKNKVLAEKLQTFLQANKYSAPGFEQINTRSQYFPEKNKIEVRYFNIGDVGLANNLINVLKSFCDGTEKNCPNLIKPDSIYVKPSQLKAPKGQLEIWFDIDNAG